MRSIAGGPILAVALVACQGCTVTWSPDRQTCPGPAADDYYFAAGALSLFNRRGDAGDRRWLSGFLSAAGEPSLSCGEPGTVYRFTWLRTFHHPVVVRVTDFGSHAIVQTTELTGKGGYAPGTVLRRTRKKISAEAFGALRKAFATERFSLLTTHEIWSEVGLDGSEWVVEAAEGGRYHLAMRWSPRNGPIRALGDRFLALAGRDLGEVY